MGLQHLHHHGIVHRDLKPGNLLMTSLHTDHSSQNAQFDGIDLYRSNYRIVIADLGQSEFLDVKIRRSSTGQTGTLGFAAPELKTMHIMDQTEEKNQQSSNDDTWNEQSDIWSLGHILYFLAFNL